MYFCYGVFCDFCCASLATLVKLSWPVYEHGYRTMQSPNMICDMGYIGWFLDNIKGGDICF